MLGIVKAPKRPPKGLHVPTVTRQDTITTILEESERPNLPLRVSFLQLRKGTRVEPGPLSVLVRRGRPGTLEQYLLGLTLAVGGEHDVRRDSRVWARAVVGRDDDAARRTISRNWALLRDLGLVRVERSGRLARVTFLREDGSGEAYTHPGQRGGTHYLRLPFDYWLDGWYDRLSLPGKALLLIALSHGDFFGLPPEKGPDWYGMSRSTVDRGLRELRRAKILEARMAAKKAPLAPLGYTIQNFYRLKPPFGPIGKFSKGAPEDLVASFTESTTSRPSRQAAAGDS